MMKTYDVQLRGLPYGFYVYGHPPTSSEVYAMLARRGLSDLVGISWTVEEVVERFDFGDGKLPKLYNHKPTFPVPVERKSDEQVKLIEVKRPQEPKEKRSVGRPKGPYIPISRNRYKL